MDRARSALAAEILTASRAHDARQTDRLARYRNLEPETASLLALLIRATRARRVLEVGTSNGYSTLWLADAVEVTAGHLLTLEIDPARTAQARENLERAGLAELVECRTQGAAQALAEQPADAWEFVFLDAERPQYAAFWSRLVEVIAPGGLVAIDNAISHAPELAAVQALIAADRRLESSLVPIGAGLLLVVLAR
ncbi:MAG TPA: class I SAM-dependent methyltransferase [Solirubrobacteraceae bacterium]